jgi:PPK2 family polyphosphate:nucleotide phosphotransferase
MDAGGKDSAIKHVMSGVNPQSCQVFSSKAPSHEELDHDYLRHSMRALPERGRIGIFNRSYYEEVLVAPVHPEILNKQQLPPALMTEHIWRERYEDINAMERYLSRNGIIIRKFFLFVSREEQRKRLLARLDDSSKHWKVSLDDVHERACWNDYMHAYEQVIRHTSSEQAPWFVVSADHKWFTRLVVAAAVIDALEDMHLACPKLTAEKRQKIQAARAFLEDSSQSVHNKR